MLWGCLRRLTAASLYQEREVYWYKSGESAGLGLENPPSRESERRAEFGGWDYLASPFHHGLISGIT